MEPMLDVSNLSFDYLSASSCLPVIDNISFQAFEGDFISIVGPSGCGKSTTLRMIAGLEEISDGELWIDGELCNYYEPGERGLSMVFQNYALYPNMTVYGNLAYALKIRKIPKKEIDEKVHKVAKTLEIEHLLDRRPAALSGGQKQRCACARALINRPDLILADEPTGALDSRSAQMLLETFTAMNDEMGATILMVTHDAFSASYCSRILFLKDGEIFHELVKGAESRREFLNEILDVLSLTGGEGSCE